jgi:cytochrome c-type biogenesis protein CcmH
MITFWLVAAALMAAGVLMLAPALLKRRATRDLDRDAQNVAIARERLRELEAERDRGELTPAAFEQAKLELERILASDLAGGDEAQTRGKGDKAGPLALGALLVVVPPITVGLYLALGAPQHVDVVGPGAGSAAQVATHGAEGPQMNIEELLGRLEQRLAENPTDPEGWAMLARSYMALERYPDAVRALDKLRELVGDEPAVLIPLADAVAMTQGGQMAGRPTELIRKALEVDPENAIANWLGGNAAAEATDWQAAIDHWRKALAQVGDDAQSAEELQQRIADAEAKLGKSPSPATAPVPAGATAQSSTPAPAAAPAQTTAAPPAADATPQSVAESAAATPSPQASVQTAPAVQVQVSLAAELQARVVPTDTVFVFARAPAGPPMPIAAVRLQASQLPLTVTLDDSTSMMPAMRLSQFPEVRIEARVAKGGTPVAAPGDLRSQPATAKVGGGAPVALVIDTVQP